MKEKPKRNNDGKDRKDFWEVIADFLTAGGFFLVLGLALAISITASIVFR